MHRLAAGGEHFANGAQRRAKTAARERLIHLRHFNRRQLDGAEQTRRIRRQVALHAEAACIVEHRAHAQFKTETRAGDIIRMRQRQAQRHLAMESLVIILRHPVGNAALFPDQRAVVERRHQRVTPWLHERGEVNHRLQQGTDRAVCVERAVKSFEARVAPADQRLHLAVLGIGNHDCAFETTRGLARALDLRQPFRQRLFGGGLRHGIESGENIQAFGAQIVFAVIALELATHQIEKRRVRGSAHGGLFNHVQRRGRGIRLLFGREHGELGHFIEHQIAARERALRVTARVVVTRPLDHGDQQRRLRQCQILERLAEVERTGEADTVDGAIAILAEIDFVEIGFEDIALVVVQFEQQRH